ncbi:MAG: shikimate kinase, partial [Actinomycetes bacterium]
MVLVGNQGSGKTTAGKALAKHLDVAFRDTDRDVEAETGTSVSDIFIQKGEQQFRALERAAVQTAIAEHHGVLALGGGAVL